MRNGLALLFLILSASPAAAVPILDEAFVGFAGIGFSPAPAPGALDSDAWRVTGLSDGDGAFGGTHLGGDFARGTSTGGVGTGGVYAFEVAPGDRALGVQATGSDATPGAIELRIPGGVPGGADAIAIGYELHYRGDGARATAIDFSIANAGAPAVGVPALGALTPGAAIADAPWTVLSLAAALPAALFAAGEDLIVRWTFDDAGGGGSRDEIAIDDVHLSAFGLPVAVPEPRHLALAALIGTVIATWRRRRHVRVTSA